MQIWMKMLVQGQVIDMIIGLEPLPMVWRNNIRISLEQLYHPLSASSREEMGRNIQFLYQPDDLCEN